MNNISIIIAQYIPSVLLAIMTVFFKYVVLAKLKKIDVSNIVNTNTTTVNALVDRVYNLRTDVDDSIAKMSEDVKKTVSDALEEQTRLVHLAMAELIAAKEKSEQLIQENVMLRAELRRKQNDDRENKETTGQ